MLQTFRIQWRDLRRRDVLWRLFWITFLLVFVAGFIWLFSITQGVIPRHVIVTIDTNGVPAIFGVKLANTNIRSATFYALDTLKIKPAVRADDFQQAFSLIRRSGMGTNVMVIVPAPPWKKP